jgi:REP element-mobilizing transposase RayT
MTIARSKQINTSETRWYHCMTQCVQQALLLGKGTFDRKEWLEDRLKELAEIFAVGVGGFSVMDTHLHLLLRIDPEVAEGLTDEQVTRRWARLFPFPHRDKSREPPPIDDDWVQERLKDTAWVTEIRKRLQSMSWFMKCLKEPLARMANREAKTRGAFFASRFKSVAILDEEALLAVSTYIDLNPIAAGIATAPETSNYTSIKKRVEHVQAQVETARLEAAASGSVAGSRAADGLEELLWLCPIEDRRQLDSSREGMFDGLSLGHYLLVVDFTGRLFREGKAAISPNLAGIFERLGSRAENWQARMEKLRKGRLFGRFFAASREKLQEVAGHLGLRRIVNLAGCAVQ